MTPIPYPLWGFLKDRHQFLPCLLLAYREDPFSYLTIHGHWIPAESISFFSTDVNYAEKEHNR